MPLPSPDTTPPVTNIYFAIGSLRAVSFYSPYLLFMIFCLQHRRLRDGIFRGLDAVVGKLDAAGKGGHRRAGHIDGLFGIADNEVAAPQVDQHILSHPAPAV